MKKVQPPGDKRGFDAWISLAHQNLPVRIRIVEKDGTAFDSVVARIDYPDSLLCGTPRCLARHPRKPRSGRMQSIICARR